MNAHRPIWTWRGVRGTAIDSIWASVWPLLAPAVALYGGRYDQASVLEAIRRGDFQLWLAGPGNDHRLALTTEIRVYPCQKWVNITFIGGNGLPLAFDFLGTIEDWAQAQGCVGVECGGRHEWSRILKKRGYQETGRTYCKRLDGE